MSLCGVLVCALLLEGVTRSFYYHHLDYQIEMCRYALLLKRQTGGTVPAHEHFPGSKARLMGVDVEINSLGFRDIERSPQKPKNVFRILLLGDSITFGWGVEKENRFSDILERELNLSSKKISPSRQYEVLNTGIGNFNTVQEIDLFKRKGRDYHPDLVILNYFLNDAEPAARKKGSFLLKHSYLAMWFWGRWDQLVRAAGQRPSYRDYYEALYKPGSSSWEKSQAAFRELDGLVKSSGSKWILVMIPEMRGTGPDYFFQDIHGQVEKTARENGADGVLDLASSFKDARTSELVVSPTDAHPNARAHRLIAQALFEFLTRSNLLPAELPDESH